MYLQLAENQPLLLSKGIFKKAFKGVKKLGLAIPRNAYLGMLELNVHGFASKLKKANEINANKVKSKWESLGGNYLKLVSAFNKGAKKKHLFDNAEVVMSESGQLFLSVGPFAAAIAAAAPIIAAISPLLKSILPAKDAAEVDKTIEDIKATADTATTAALGIDPTAPEHAEKFEKEHDTFLSSIPKPVLYGGIALVAYLLLRKKK